MQNRIIITTGYMGSGSSAATDLVAEFKDCKNEFKSHEYVFLHCPDGLFDLEDKLLLGNHALRSDEALRTFQNRMHDLYNKRFWWVGNYKDTAGAEFQKYCDAFVEELTQFEYEGYWYMSEYPDAKMIAKLVVRKPFKILFSKFHTFKKVTRYNNEMKISYVQADEFYKRAKNMIYNIINMMRKNKPNILLDQLILPFNLYRIDHYFNDDTYAIVVDRDPRDVFLLNKYIWRKNNLSLAVPTDVHQYCEFYRKMRESEIISNSNKILRIHFEDMVYQYDKTVEQIRKHLNFTEDDHVFKKERFDPELSIRNTQLFHTEHFQEEVAVIEKCLHEYLYDFPYKIENIVEKSIEFD